MSSDRAFYRFGSVKLFGASSHERAPEKPTDEATDNRSICSDGFLAFPVQLDQQRGEPVEMRELIHFTPPTLTDLSAAGFQPHAD